MMTLTAKPLLVILSTSLLSQVNSQAIALIVTQTTEIKYYLRAHRT